MRSIKTYTKPLSGALLAFAFFCGPAIAQSPLTTIQDTLFKADGTRFNGTVTIRWNTFDAANLGAVVQQSRNVQVANGNLQVQLAPNAGAAAPANAYTVQYQSDGREQFTETWTVPPSAQALRIAQVRTGMITSTSVATAGNSTPIPEANIVGLVSDLGQRPVKGPGFGTGSVAFINSDGQIETAVGNIGDCVYIDGTAGSCGSPSPTFYDAETPGGLVDGSNLTFTLANPPTGLSLQLFRNGLYMKAGFDYTLTGSTLAFASGAAPQPLDTLVASYRVDPDAGNVAQLQLSSAHTTSLAQVICSTNGRDTNVGTSISLGACDIPAAAIRNGDRFEVRFDYTHTGSASEFDFEVKWGGTSIIARHGSALDTAVSGRAEASIGSAGAQLAVQSWGTTLSFLPGIVTAPAQSGLTVDLRGLITTPGSDRLTLTSFTVLRYPGN